MDLLIVAERTIAPDGPPRPALLRRRHPALGHRPHLGGARRLRHPDDRRGRDPHARPPFTRRGARSRHARAACRFGDQHGGPADPVHPRPGGSDPRSEADDHVAIGGPFPRRSLRDLVRRERPAVARPRADSRACAPLPLLAVPGGPRAVRRATPRHAQPSRHLHRLAPRACCAPRPDGGRVREPRGRGHRGRRALPPRAADRPLPVRLRRGRSRVSRARRAHPRLGGAERGRRRRMGVRTCRRHARGGRRPLPAPPGGARRPPPHARRSPTAGWRTRGSRS